MLHSSTNYYISEFLTIAPCIKKVSHCVYVISHMLTCRVVYCCLTTHGNIFKHGHMSLSRVELHSLIKWSFILNNYDCFD